ncbi:MAG: biotin--[acetyl-CoA-carboxylase] ligase [Cyclobacteriaceae bacterium]
MYKILANTLFIGKKLVFVPECHSTNSIALELSQKKDLLEGTILITDHQSRGRGQQGNAWISEPGKNLTFSIVLKPSFLAIKDQFLLNMVVSLGVRDYVQTKLPTPVFVKWPNDVLVEEQKVCGILIENQIQGAGFTNSIIGIGLNVNQQGFHLNNAVSLIIVSGQNYELQGALEELCGHLEKWYLTLKQNGSDRVREYYLNALFGLGERRIFKSKEREFWGVIEGVDDHGRLMIKENGKTHHFNNKEVQFNFEPLK